MWFFSQLAEQRIEEAQARGDFDDLPGAGQPLVLDDDRLIPEHQRLAYRILKNSGYLPPELAQHREAVEIALQLAQLEAGEHKCQLLARLTRINLWLAESGKRQLMVPLDYAERLADILVGHKTGGAGLSCNRLAQQEE